MAIGDLVTASSDGTGTTLTYAHSVAGASNRCIWAAAYSFRSGGSSDPTGVTHAGSALTKIANFAGGGANDNAGSLWRLLAPATGANNVVVTHSASHDITAISLSYSGVDQTTPNDTVQALDSADTDPTDSVTSATGDQVVSFIVGWGWVTLGEDGDLTIRLSNDNGSGLNSAAVGDAPGAATVNASWTTTTYTDPGGLFSFNVNADSTPVESPPSFVAAGTAAFTATNGATIAPGLPSGWAADDIHVLLAARSDNTAMTTLSGWTQIAALSGNNTAAQRVEVWVRRAVGGDTAPTVTFGTGTVVRGARIYGIRGVPNTGTVADQIDVQSRLDNAASATVSFTDVNTTGTNRLILALAAYEDDPTTLSTLTGYTNPAQGTNVSALGNDMGLYHQWKALPTAGAGGGGNGTVSGGTFANSVNVGILIAFKPIPVAGLTSTVVGAQPAATGTLARLLAALRSVVGAQPSPTGTLARLIAVSRSLAGTQPAATGTLARKLIALRSAAGAQPSGTGTLVAAVTFLRNVAGAQPSGTGTLTRIRGYARTLTGAQPAGTGTLARRLAALRSLVGAQPAPTGTLARSAARTSSLAGAQPAATGTLVSQQSVGRNVAGAQPAATGTLARIKSMVRALAGAQPSATGTLTRKLTALRALAGAQPAATGILTRSQVRARSLAGAQPAPTGTLAGQQSVGRQIAGAQPTATGALTRRLAALRALAGAQPAATGTLGRLLVALRALAGSQPAPTGGVTRSKANTRTLAGAQPAGSGTLTGQQTASRSLSGAQPAATGALARLLAATRHLVGTQPEPTGALARSWATTESLAGVQPSASGEVTWFLGTPMEGPSATILVVRRPIATATLVRRSSAAGSVVRRPIAELALVGR